MMVVEVEEGVVGGVGAKAGGGGVGHGSSHTCAV